MPAVHFEESRPDLAPYGFTCEVWEPQPMRRRTDCGPRARSGGRVRLLSREYRRVHRG